MTTDQLQLSITNLDRAIKEARAAGDLDRVDFLCLMRDGYVSDLAVRAAIVKRGYIAS